jgi:lysophospholipase L1-like esterase
MKSLKYIGLGIVALGLFSCTKTEYEEFEATNGGTANFTTYIAVGNSLTQGYQDGGLHNEYNQQDNSFPAIIAKQMGTSFVQPTVKSADGSGYRKLLSLAPNITTVAGVSGWNNWDKNAKYNNLGIAGIKLTDCVPTAGDPFSPTINQVVTSGNPFGNFLEFGVPLSTPPVSYLEYVKQSSATFFTCWLGNNDVLGWATAGGDNGTTTIPGLGTLNLSELTPVSVFRVKYDSILDAFQAMGAKGVCATLPDVTSIPYFTTVPHNPIPMDAATASQTNSAYTSYNGGLDSYQAGGAISAAEVSRRKINFTASSSNAIVIEDESLTTLPGLPNIRQATAADLIILPASSDIGRQLDPSNPASIYGVGVAFADSLVLTEAEVAEVQNHTNMLNNEIRTSASNHGVALADMYSYMFELQAGMTFDGVEYGAKYIEGGAFSLDGVHPNTRGYAIIANKFIETINSYYGSNLKPVPVQNYRGIIFP